MKDPKEAAAGEAAAEHLMLALLRESDQLRRILDLREHEAATEVRPYDQVLHAAASRLLDPVGKITVRMATEAANRGTFHWTLTLTGMSNNRQSIVGDHGVIRPKTTDTRQSICERLISTVKTAAEKRSGHALTDIKVLFFDLQPNDLS
ncbi:hypothetical protein [Streptomyces agglomeratus]|uniref:hypothetical protein n=1 Tax=Streptomyces agglomeratus TaxID=285458 RepID=UPI000853FD77|nr:hypothetical protein [Streptomyces agglomeratus]OEJ36307.1 hypothetical protein BGK72_38770 [Streptomyces agglomeratus]